jgi:DNA-directed RNA polymerase subunit RPC12/RpoP
MSEEIRDPPTSRFHCVDCGARVIRYAPSTLPAERPTRCLTCEYIAEIADPIERAEVRRRLMTEREGC